MIKTALFIALGLVALGFIWTWWSTAKAHLGDDPGGTRPTCLEALVGFVTDFLDALGIGSFATTTAIFVLRKMVPPRVIPGTLNVGHTLPSVTQAFIYIAILDVDATTLLLLIAAAVVGAWFGAGLVAGWSRRKVQLGMGLALLVASTMMLLTQLGWIPGGGEAQGLEGVSLAMGIVGNLFLGALMSLGIGLYAPAMIMVSLLGMTPKAAFPIMMGSCAFLMSIGSIRFIRSGSYSLRPALGLTLGGIPGVMVAAFLVKSLPLDVMRWGIIAVVLYTAIAMLRAVRNDPRTEASP